MKEHPEDQAAGACAAIGVLVALLFGSVIWLSVEAEKVRQRDIRIIELEARNEELMKVIKEKK